MTMTPSRRRAAAIAVDCLLILFMCWSLTRPLFKAKYLDKFDSIESTFISDARFLKDHWPHPGWHPLWYCGTRFDYIYPPALRYGTAVLSNIWIPPKAYHVYTAFFYGMGILGVYVLMLVGARSRLAALVAAAATATLSPSFAFLSAIRVDSSWLTPNRLGALVRYGEGPHITALSVLPFALACAYFGLRRGRPAALAGAAVLSALVVSNNFYGATALAMFFPILVWSLWVTHGDRFIWLRAAAIAALAYGLTAFWLSPSYLRVTLYNMQFVSERGNAWSAALAAAAAAGYAFGTWKLARGKPERAWTVFVLGALLFFSLDVLGNAWFNFRVIGEPGRLAPELDLVMILAALEGLRRLWRWRPARARFAPPVAAVVLIAGGFAPAWVYLDHARELYPLHNDYRQRIEYRIAEWVDRNLPGARVLATGSVRFWYNAWFDGAQLGGGSEQGVLNPNVVLAQWEIVQNENAEAGVRWMQAMGVDAVIVHGKNSQELYHDFPKPAKFAGVLPVLYDNGAGDVVYKVPRRYPGLARVVDGRGLAALEPIGVPNPNAAHAYAALVEQGPPVPAATEWRGTDELRVRARVEAGQAVVVQVNYDPAWRAASAGRPLEIRKDAMGFMAIDAPPGDHDIRLTFTLPLENAIGRVLTVLASAIIIGLFAAGVRARRRPLPVQQEMARA